MKEFFENIIVQLKKLDGLFLVLIFLFSVYLIHTAQVDIDTNLTVGSGKVYKIESAYKKYSKRKYFYEFYYNGERYTGKSNAFKNKNIKIGDSFQVEFSSENPDNNRILFNVPIQKQVQ